MNRAIIFFALAASSLHAAPPAKFFRALHIVETSGRRGAIIGDNGQALGPLQIHRDYFLDARIGGSYSRCADLEFSKRVVSAYLRRYAPGAWKRGDVEALARVHNGGPHGAAKWQTIRYAQKVSRIAGGGR